MHKLQYLVQPLGVRKGRLVFDLYFGQILPVERVAYHTGVVELLIQILAIELVGHLRELVGGEVAERRRRHVLATGRVAPVIHVQQLAADTRQRVVHHRVPVDRLLEARFGRLLEHVVDQIVDRRQYRVEALLRLAVLGRVFRQVVVGLTQHLVGARQIDVRERRQRRDVEVVQLALLDILALTLLHRLTLDGLRRVHRVPFRFGGHPQDALLVVLKREAENFNLKNQINTASKVKRIMNHEGEEQI